MALSYDVDKLKDLIKRFSPDSDQSLFGVFGTQGKMIESIVGDELSDMMNGNVGMMIGSEEPKEDLVGMGSIPNVNLYLGLGKDTRSEEHTFELQSRPHLVCRLLLEKKKKENMPD